MKRRIVRIGSRNGNPNRMGVEPGRRAARRASASNGDGLTGAGIGVTPANLDARVALIQALIPLGLAAVNDALQQEVTALAGARYRHGDGCAGHARWGSQRGSVFLADQKLPIRVPRVRDVAADVEVPLETYQALRNPRRADESALRKVLKGLSCRDYESCVEPLAETFGLSGSSLSRRFVRASARKLAAISERDLSKYELVALFLDGKTFGADQMVIALGVTLRGEKVVLGFVQTATENEAVCGEFLRGLLSRGLQTEPGVLVVIDGAKGLRKAVDVVFNGRALVQRCQWHKRENVVKYLGKSQQATFRRKLQQAYEKPGYDEARTALKKVRSELGAINASAVASLDEGFEETLTLHRLGLFAELGVSFKTTNCIENLNALVGQRTDKVDHWRNPEQKHRWLAAALLDIEPRLKKVRGHRHLARLRTAIQTELNARRATPHPKRNVA
ncbi:MAG: IS256 family transposase [Candidatus Hydrogenedentes bacterium]|nr:IS256 family transposase [Candidatus Hydrogenedentota bacterium]